MGSAAQRTGDHHLTFWRQSSASRAAPPASNLVKRRERKSTRSCWLCCLPGGGKGGAHGERTCSRLTLRPRFEARGRKQVGDVLLAEFNQKLEQTIRESGLRVVVPRPTEFDTVREAAILAGDG